VLSPHLNCRPRCERPKRRLGNMQGGYQTARLLNNGKQKRAVWTDVLQDANRLDAMSHCLTGRSTCLALPPMDSRECFSGLEKRSRDGLAGRPTAFQQPIQPADSEPPRRQSQLPELFFFSGVSTNCEQIPSWHAKCKSLRPSGGHRFSGEAGQWVFGKSVQLRKDSEL
jgi:hypothetical protein